MQSGWNPDPTLDEVPRTDSGARSSQGDVGNSREPAFDFATHSNHAAVEYQKIRGQYNDFADQLAGLFKTFVTSRQLNIHTLEYRAKDVESFRAKAGKATAENPNLPRYPNPLLEITDLAAVRIITFFLEDVQALEQTILDELDVLEKTDKSDLLEREERLGYHSVHYIVSFGAQRLALPEYARFRDLRAEIQVRTILQHVWAEIEHDVQYKAQTALPAQIRRRFMTLAGLLEIADREFQEIQTEDERLRRSAQEAVAAGNLAAVEITTEALKSYLDQKLGADGRMTPTAYGYTVRLLDRLGFRDLDQLDAAITPYDSDHISRLLTNARQGQLTRLDLVLLAALGQYFVDRNPSAKSDSEYRDQCERDLRKLIEQGVQVGQGLSIVNPETAD